VKVIEMINGLNVNQRVGAICINLNDKNPMNGEIIRMMINNYKNVFTIIVYDGSDSVDNEVHDQIK